MRKKVTSVNSKPVVEVGGGTHFKETDGGGTHAKDREDIGLLRTGAASF